jgi:hypothetical protein
MEVQGERMYSSYSFTTSEQDGMSGQLHAPASLYPRGKDPPPGNHWIEGWVGPKIGLTQTLEEKFCCLCRGSNLDRPVVQSVFRPSLVMLTTFYIQFLIPCFHFHIWHACNVGRRIYSVPPFFEMLLFLVIVLTRNALIGGYSLGRSQDSNTVFVTLCHVSAQKRT